MSDKSKDQEAKALKEHKIRIKHLMYRPQSKRITLWWMNLIRRRMEKLDIDLRSKEWQFIAPIFIKGMSAEQRINEDFDKE